MTIIEDLFNSERILTYIDTLTISEKECNELKIFGKLERKKLIREYIQLIKSNKLPKTSNPKDYITKKLLTQRNYSNKYNNLSTQKREIIYANALLPNDAEIAELLNSNNFSIEHLKEIIRARKYFLNIINSQNIIITDEILEQFAIYKRVITKLVNLFEAKFGINDSTIILNRICEMLVTCPTFFDSIQHTK